MGLSRYHETAPYFCSSKSENVRDLLSLKTKIKMVPNSSDITDKSIEFELVAYKHFRLADGSDMVCALASVSNLSSRKGFMDKMKDFFE